MSSLRGHAIITRSLYIYYPDFEDHCCRTVAWCFFIHTLDKQQIGAIRGFVIIKSKIPCAQTSWAPDIIFTCPFLEIFHQLPSLFNTTKLYKNICWHLLMKWQSLFYSQLKFGVKYFRTRMKPQSEMPRPHVDYFLKLFEAVRNILVMSFWSKLIWANLW